MDRPDIEAIRKRVALAGRLLFPWYRGHISSVQSLLAYIEELEAARTGHGEAEVRALVEAVKDHMGKHHPSEHHHDCGHPDEDCSCYMVHYSSLLEALAPFNKETPCQSDSP